MARFVAALLFLWAQAASAQTPTGVFDFVNELAGATTYQLTTPAECVSPCISNGRMTVIDNTGTAGTSNVTITPASGLINGQTSYVLNVAYQAATFYWDGQNWFLMGTTFANTSGAPINETISTATGTGATQTLPATNLLTTISNITVSAVWSLPTIQAAGFKECLKDGTTNFQTLPQTVKPNPTTLTIDGVAGSTGIVLNQNRQEKCFVSNGTNWAIE